MSVSKAELNKKLAEWAGLEWKWNHNPDCHCGAVDDDDSMRSWHAPDGKLATRFYHEDIGFTHSLDACWKWLVPKLFEQNIEVALFTKRGETDGCILTLNNEKYMCSGKYEVSKTLCVDAETLALALCRAIEKLIDAENK